MQNNLKLLVEPFETELLKEIETHSNFFVSGEFDLKFDCSRNKLTYIRTDFDKLLFNIFVKNCNPVIVNTVKAEVLKFIETIALNVIKIGYRVSICQDRTINGPLYQAYGFNVIISQI